MKIKKFKHSKNKILKLQALKLYKSNLKKNNKKQLFLIQANLIKISNIIYKYITTNKKILFLGFPTKLKNTLKNTNHKVVPEYLSFNGIITNQISLNKIKKMKSASLSTLKLLLKIKKIDLVVIYNQDKKSTAIQESYISRVPTIVFSNNINFNSKISYQTLGNYTFLNEKTKDTNFTLSFITSIIKKAENHKQLNSKRY